MKRFITFAAALMMCITAQARERATMRKPYPLHFLQSEVMDQTRSWAPDAAMDLNWFARIANLNPTSTIGVRILLVTTPLPGDVPRPVRDFTNPAFLAIHPRYSAGAFTVKLFRDHDYLYPTPAELEPWTPEKDARGVYARSRCETQSVSLPAKPGQRLLVNVDLSKFTQPTDSLILELWPGYDYRLEVLGADGVWHVITTIGLPRDLPPGQFLGYEQMATGDCSRE